MTKVKPRTLSGFMELLPPKQVYFNTILHNIQNTFSLYGFTPLDTPLMEAREILLAKGGGETEKQVYTLSRGDSDLALRYELTTSLAKYVTLYYNELAFPFRRYEIGKVYRGERSQRGRFREFYQADIDIIGDGDLSTLNEAEIPAVIYECFSSLGLTGFIIRINNRKILNGFFDIIGIKGNSTQIMRNIDKLEKIGREKVLKILTDEENLSPAAANELIDFISKHNEPFSFLEKYKGRNELFDEGCSELISLTRHLVSFGVPETHFAVDLSIARGLDYYTGTVYETFLTEHPGVGSVCSGGRYDNLSECFTDRKMPGTGISIGLTRLFYILQEQGLLDETFPVNPVDVLIIPMTGDLSYAIRLSAKMRQSGLRVQVFGENKKIKQKVSYADKLAVPYVVFIGEDEIEKNMITVKDMKSGRQTTASEAILIAGICDRINELKRNVIKQ